MKRVICGDHAVRVVEYRLWFPDVVNGRWMWLKKVAAFEHFTNKDQYGFEHPEPAWRFYSYHWNQL